MPLLGSALQSLKLWVRRSEAWQNVSLLCVYNKVFARLEKDVIMCMCYYYFVKRVRMKSQRVCIYK